MSEMKPCPFCGVHSDESGEHRHEEDCFFSAYDRLLSAKNSSLSEVPAVLRGWNRRAIPSDQVMVPRELLERILANLETAYVHWEETKELRTILHP